ncbi:MAG: transporter substrate-binding domain-containing protein [Eubacteriales bacterium]|nr:transporter substrate-binding domain-containing protein [Eubacteriales bacterium]
MKKTVKFVALVLALALVSMLFAACGQKSAVEQIKKNGKITMLTNAAFAPFEYLGADNAVAGVDVEIAQAVADELGVTLEVVDMDFDGIVAAVQTGKGDLGVAGMTATEERAKSVDFSINYVDTAQMIIVPEGSAIATVEDLTGKNIGVQMGTTGDLYASDYVEGATIQRLKTGADAGLALANGQLDAVVIDAMPAQQIVSANAGLKILDTPLTEEQYAIAIAKDSDLKPVVDKVLEKLLADGTVDALIEKHMAASAG